MNATDINRRINQLTMVGERLDQAQRHVLASESDEWTLPVALPGTLSMMPIPLTRDQAIWALTVLTRANFDTLRGLYEELEAAAGMITEWRCQRCGVMWDENEGEHKPCTCDRRHTVELTRHRVGGRL